MVLEKALLLRLVSGPSVMKVARGHRSFMVRELVVTLVCIELVLVLAIGGRVSVMAVSLCSCRSVARGCREVCVVSWVSCGRCLVRVW